jgi:signal transduction histidine kinase
MNDALEREESLREAILSLEHARQQERRLREEYAGLLRALGVLSAPVDQHQLLTELVGHVRVPLGATHAHVLELDTNAEWLVVTASTLDRALGAHLRPVGVVGRGLRGPPKMVFDTRYLPEWSEDVWAPFGGARSLLVANLRPRGSPLLLVCSQERVAAFRATEAQLIASFGPLVERALEDLEVRELRQQQLLAAERAALLEYATDAMGVGLLCVDADCRVSYASPTLERLARPWGSPQDWCELVVARCCLGGRASVLVTPEPADATEVELTRPDGGQSHFEVHWIGEAELGPSGQVVLVRDVTERSLGEAALERSQEQLRQATKMQAVGRLAGGVAHDFNNLLSVMLGSAELALRGLPADCAERRYLDEIVETTKHGAALTRQLLSFSRRPITQKRPLVLNPAVLELVEMLARLIRQDIEITLDLAEDLGAARIDRGQLEQVLLNLTLNARDAIVGPGRIRVATANLEVDGERERLFPQTPTGSYVTLTVSDNGCGIDSDALSLVFEPFFTTKARGAGSGMGLTTVYGIVHQALGSIEIVSKVGEGSTFRICLPRVEPEPSVSDARSSLRPPPRGAGNILLAEDNVALCRLVARHLTSGGYQVVETNSALEALELGRNSERDFDLLITDVIMPGLRGDELAHELRAVRPDLQVLLISGYANGADDTPAANPDFELLEKPFTADDLLRAVQELLEE